MQKEKPRLPGGHRPASNELLRHDPILVKVFFKTSFNLFYLIFLIYHLNDFGLVVGTGNYNCLLLFFYKDVI